MRIRCIPKITKLWLALATVLVLLPADHSFGAKWTGLGPPPGQPSQIRSQVKYDPNLSDALFESEEWSYPCSIPKLPDGRAPDAKELRVQHTARCISSHHYRHTINFCRAKLLDGKRLNCLFMTRVTTVHRHMTI